MIALEKDAIKKHYEDPAFVRSYTIDEIGAVLNERFHPFSRSKI